MILDGSAYVGDGVWRQGTEIDPAQLVAFMRLIVKGLPGPGADLHKEVDALVALIAVHDAREEDVGSIDLHANLLGRLALSGSQNGLIAIQVPGGDTVFPVTVAGVEAAQQEDLPGA